MINADHMTGEDSFERERNFQVYRVLVRIAGNENFCFGALPLYKAQLREWCCNRDIDFLVVTHFLVQVFDD